MQILEGLQERRKAQLEASFHAFVVDAFEVLHPGQTIVDNWHVRYLCGVLQTEIERLVRGEPKTQDIIINVPPRSLKSFVTTICLPAYAWTLNPRLKFIGSSYSAELSIEHNTATRTLIESEWYKQFWGDTVVLADDQNAKGKFKNTQQGVRRATSTGGSITGGGGDVIIVDDPINPLMAASEAERKNAIKYFDETLTTRLDNPDRGLFIIIMQRLHEEDLTGHLLKKQPAKYKHICIPAELSKDVQPPELASYYTDGLFFPQRFTRSFLADLKVSLGTYGYAGQLSQRPSPEAGGVIKREWFPVVDYSEFIARVGPKFVRDFFCDPAYTDDPNNDPTALMVTVKHGANLYLLDSEQVWKEFPHLIKHIRSYVPRLGGSYQSKLLIEPKASGLSIIQTLKEETSFNVISLPPPKDDKLTRVNAKTPSMEAGRCILVRGPWNENFLEECVAFPNGAHDDQVDNLTNAMNYYYPHKKNTLAYA